MKKEIIITVVFIILFILIAMYGIDRIDKINNGEMVQVSESYMK